jgi:hypothetical protein
LSTRICFQKARETVDAAGLAVAFRWAAPLQRTAQASSVDSRKSVSTSPSAHGSRRPDPAQGTTHAPAQRNLLAQQARPFVARGHQARHALGKPELPPNSDFTEICQIVRTHAISACSSVIGKPNGLLAGKRKMFGGAVCGSAACVRRKRDLRSDSMPASTTRPK